MFSIVFSLCSNTAYRKASFLIRPWSIDQWHESLKNRLNMVPSFCSWYWNKISKMSASPETIGDGWYPSAAYLYNWQYYLKFILSTSIQRLKHKIFQMSQQCWTKRGRLESERNNLKNKFGDRGSTWTIRKYKESRMEIH